MEVHIVGEGKTDETILRQILRSELAEHPGQLKIIAAGGESSAQSLASSIAAVRREPVALVLDADTTDSEKIAEQRDVLEWLMKQSASADSWQIVLFRPTIESILFADPAILTDTLGVSPDEKQQVRAEYDPKRVLDDLLDAAHISSEKFWHRLAHLKYEWDPLVTKSPELKSLKDFIHRHLQPIAA